MTTSAIFGVNPLNFEDIKEYTSNLSKDNFIGKSQYGKLYRGWKGEQEVAVKVWDLADSTGHHELIEEFYLFKRGDVKGHPKPINFCDDDINPCAMVYDLKPLDTLYNLIPKDNFSWVNRVKVALGFASALKSYHKESWPFKIRNIDAAHIICDQEYTPILYDFGMIAGGVFKERWRFDGREGSDGYIDPYLKEKGCCTTKTDVFAYGVLLLGLITKKVYVAGRDSEYINQWAEKEYNRQRKLGKRFPSLVDESLRSQPYFTRTDGCRITELAMRCIKFEPDERPDINEAIKILQGLQVVRRNGETGVKTVLDMI